MISLITSLNSGLPITELLLEALLDKVRRQQRQQRKPGKGLDPEAVKLYTIAQPDVV